jgi:hypothetical protein
MYTDIFLSKISAQTKSHHNFNVQRNSFKQATTQRIKTSRYKNRIAHPYSIKFSVKNYNMTVLGHTLCQLPFLTWIFNPANIPQLIMVQKGIILYHPVFLSCYSKWFCTGIQYTSIDRWHVKVHNPRSGLHNDIFNIFTLPWFKWQKYSWSNFWVCLQIKTFHSLPFSTTNHTNENANLKCY